MKPQRIIVALLALALLVAAGGAPEGGRPGAQGGGAGPAAATGHIGAQTGGGGPGGARRFRGRSRAAGNV